MPSRMERESSTDLHPQLYALLPRLDPIQDCWDLLAGRMSAASSAWQALRQWLGELAGLVGQ